MKPDKQSQLLEDVASIKTILDTMNRRLFGNGQPGYIQDMDTRIDVLEKDRAKASGIMWVLGVLFSFFGGAEVLHWIRNGK